MMKIRLLRGPLDGQTDSNVPGHCDIYRRRASGPLARYRASGKVDANGYHIFEWWPPKPNESGVTLDEYDAQDVYGVYDAD
jgi:hypothetical protein